MSGGGDWSPGFFEELAEVSPELESEAEELVRPLREHRSSKAARKL